MKASKLVGRRIISVSQAPLRNTNWGGRAAELLSIRLDNGSVLYLDINHTEDLPFVSGRLVPKEKTHGHP